MTGAAGLSEDESFLAGQRHGRTIPLAALESSSSGEKHAFTSCTDLKGTVTSYYFVVPGKTGGHYVFAVAGAENVASTADMRIKPAILKAVMTR